jgi:preprotein translocase SecE subunit
MGGLVQYLKDTRQELRHVAWPTQTQTIVYTLLVAAISLGVAAYLGLFDFLFTTGVGQIVNNLPAAGAAQSQPIATTSPITITPATTTQNTTQNTTK